MALDPDLVPALTALPLFPLPDAVLFPGAIVPLHIFEPRYRDLTRDALRGSRLIVLARIQPGHENKLAGSPPVVPICGLGYILSSSQLADGRYNLLLRGIARIRIEDELPTSRRYRRIRARLLDDDRTDADLSGAHRLLIAVCDRLAATLDDGAGLRELARAAPSPGACADAIAAALIADADARQELLACLDVAERVDRAIEHVSRLIHRAAPVGAPN